MIRDELESRLGKVVRGHTRAILDGYEPGLEVMRGQLADIAEQHADERAELAAKEAAAMALLSTPPDLASVTPGPVIAPGSVDRKGPIRPRSRAARPKGAES